MKLSPLQILLLYLGIIVVVAVILPTPTYWGPKYGSEHKDPLGTFILYDILPSFVKGDLVKTDRAIYNVLKDNDYSKSNYLFINDSYAPDRLDIDALLTYVDNGGQAFISANSFNYQFADTIGFSVYYYFPRIRPLTEEQDSISFYLTNQNLAADSCFVHDVLQGSYIQEFDSLSVDGFQVLGYNQDEGINFVKRTFGDGALYIHTCPAVFSNYELLYRATGNYATACLSYLTHEDLLYDDYYKSGKPENDSPLRTLFRYPALSWAWNIMLVSVILFMIFGARRMARAIPVLKPYENESLQWVETVGSMYYAHRNNRLIAKKRFDHLMLYIKRRYALSSDFLKRKDAERFYAKTGVDPKHWTDLLNQAAKLEQKQKWEADHLRKLSNTIDLIFKEIKNE